MSDQLLKLRHTARQLAEAKSLELKYEDERPVKKLAAIGRIMQDTNALTGKAHSFSSAEAVVETDAEYAAYLAERRQATANVILARAEYEAATIEARLWSHAEAMAA